MIKLLLLLLLCDNSLGFIPKLSHIKLYKYPTISYVEKYSTISYLQKYPVERNTTIVKNTIKNSNFIEYEQKFQISKNDIIKYKSTLVFLAFLWGTNFSAVKYLDTSGINVSIINTIRFFLASLSLSPFLIGISKEIILAGIDVGFWVALAYICQAFGLETIDSNISAFICSLSVVIVPLINGIKGKEISQKIWISCILAIIGVALITLPGTNNFCSGYLWSLGQPIGFGIAFIKIEHYMNKYKGKSLPLAAMQMLIVFISNLFLTLITIKEIPDLSTLTEPFHLLTLLYTGIITSALAIVLESIILSYISAEETSIILSTEPLWALITSTILLHETIKPIGILGSIIILLACYLTQVNNKN